MGTRHETRPRGIDLHVARHSGGSLRPARPDHRGRRHLRRQQGLKALAAWYRDVFGISLERWGGAIFRYDAAGHPPVLTWNAFPEGESYLAPSRREFMLNFAVGDLDAFLNRLKAKGVPILKRDDSDPNGKFAWILDPDSTKIELWQPTKR